MTIPDRDVPVILVADDDITARLLVTEALRQAGFNVLEACDGCQAVELFKQHLPELVLLDVIMPIMDGFEAADKIRAHPYGATVPILMLTGLDDVDSIARAYDVGATDFATKPINWLVLSQRVRYMLRTKRAFDELRTSQERLAAAQRIARMGNWEWNIHSGELFWSEQVFRLFELDPATCTPDYDLFINMIHPDDREQILRASEQALFSGASYEIDYRIVLPVGRIQFLHSQGEVLRDEADNPVSMAGTTQDISERKHAEARIHYLSLHDGLTDLPNRTMLAERLAEALATSRRYGRKLALLSLDVDRFKRINDTFGHGAGDVLLQEISERLQHGLRESDVIGRAQDADLSATLARPGGDEFMLLITDVDRVENVARVARRVLDVFGKPFDVSGKEVFVTASIGISLYPHDGEEPETLMKNADAALHHAKDAGRNNFEYYSKSMNAAAFERLSLENNLRIALRRNEFELYFQPQIDVRTGRVFGAEALLRWKHPEMGMISPLQFIPVAEETGMIVQLGEWVLREACNKLKSWIDLGFDNLRMAVNLSSCQFRQTELPGIVADILRTSGVNPNKLELEITESVLMQDSDSVLTTLSTIKSLGASIALDDFGTGYSSLAYLKRFPIDLLKIDRSFVKDLPQNQDDAAIAKTIIAMAHSLKLDVLAEGVETLEQQSFFAGNGCNLIQGYLYSKPLPASEFLSFLRNPGHMTGIQGSAMSHSSK